MQTIIGNSGVVNFGPIVESQNCTFSGPTNNTGGNNTNNNNTGGTTNPSMTPSMTPSSFWDKYKWWIIGLGIVILLIVIVFVVLKARKPKVNSEKPLPTEKPIVKSSQKKPTVAKTSKKKTT
jgi:uncharacterized integral membrane protein